MIKLMKKNDCGLDQSPTVMVGDNNKNNNSVKKGAYQTPVGLWLRPKTPVGLWPSPTPNPSWALVETNIQITKDLVSIQHPLVHPLHLKTCLQF